MPKGDTVATPVTDKNGKKTTVYKKVYVAPKNRVVDVVPKLAFEMQPGPAEQVERRRALIEREVVDVNHPWIQKYRLPVIEGLQAGAKFVVALTAPQENGIYGKFLEATEDEAALLGSYIQYRNYRWLGEGEIARMRELPVDLDSGVNTYTFGKKEDTWVYRAASWRDQPFWPGYDVEKRYTNLIELIDKTETYSGEPNPHWEKWKLDNGLI